MFEDHILTHHDSVIIDLCQILIFTELSRDEPDTTITLSSMHGNELHHFGLAVVANCELFVFNPGKDLPAVAVRAAAYSRKTVTRL